MSPRTHDPASPRPAQDAATAGNPPTTGAVRPAPANLRIRPYAGDVDIEPIVAIARAADLADDAPNVMTSEDFHTDVLTFEGCVPARDIIVGELDGRPVGAAYIRYALRDNEWRMDHEGWVVPDARRRGIGTQLFRTISGMAADLAATLPGPNRRRLCAYAADTNVGARRLAEAEGYVAWRWFALMTRDLREPGPVVRAPEGIEIRPIELDDRRGAFRALDEAFRDHPGAREWTEQDFHRFFEGPDTDLTLWRAAYEGDECVGATDCGSSEEEARALGIRQGWVHTIGVRRAWRGRGVAKAMVAAAIDEFRARGVERVALDVDLENPTGALKLYEDLGFTVARRMTQWTRLIPGASAPATGETAR